MFGPELESAARYAALLCTDGVVRGLIGPDEPARIWTRHLLNCAVVAELFDPDAHVADVGSGAGLPGLALAIARPDLRLTLIEPLERRCAFLADAVQALGVTDRVEVLRARAEDRGVVGRIGTPSWVTARAVAPLDRLVRWCVPLVARGGRVALLKGASASDEVDRHRQAIETRLQAVRIVRCGVGVVDVPTTVVTGTRRDRSMKTTGGRARQ